MLKLNNINKYYELKSGQRYQALKDINININRGEFIAVVGRSGSGKTTLLNILGGLDTYDNGSFYINDVNTKDYTAKDWDYYRNQRIGFIFQQFNLLYHLTVYENVELALILSGLSKEARKAKVLDIINKVGLTEHAYKKPGYLSGGEQQRVVIARAIVNDSDIILADEPTGQLDMKTAKQIMDLIKEVCENKLIVIVTHMEKLVSQYATRVIRINNGIIEEDKIIPNIKSEFIDKKNGTVKFKDLNYLSLKNIRRKLFSSITLIGMYSFILGLILTLIILSQKNVQNDIYHVLASDIPMNLVEITKSNNETYTTDEIELIKSIDNVESVIPKYYNYLSMEVNDNPIVIDSYEFLPASYNEFYLKDVLVCGEYPIKSNETILDIKIAIAIVDEQNSLYSRYNMNIISDEDIWELVKNKQIEIINENNETFIYNIVGIVNDSYWNYSNVNVYFHSDEIENLVGKDVPIKELNIYLVNIDEKSRNDTMVSIKELSNNSNFNEENIYNVNKTYDRFNQLIQFVNTIFIVLLVISIISIFALINYYMHTRIKEVGILKSLGAKSKNIKLIYILEYLYISFIGIIFSYFLSTLFINLFTKISCQFYSSSNITINDNMIYPNFIIYLLVSLGGIILMYLSIIIPIHNNIKQSAVDIIRIK